MSKVTYEARPNTGWSWFVWRVAEGGRDKIVAMDLTKDHARLFAATLNAAEALPEGTDPVKAVEATLVRIDATLAKARGEG